MQPADFTNMQSTQRRGFLIAWLALSALAVGVCSLMWPAAHLGNEIVPVGNDSFYHARRILDTVRDLSAFYEFDSHVQAPEGSLLVWPWGYDYAMALIVRIGMSMGLAHEPIAILVWIPVVAVLGSIALILSIARRLQLSTWSCALAGLVVALSPLTQALHGTGNIDHHFAEYLFVLATLAAGLKWFADLSQQRAALLLGIVLGVAPAIHNALFVLQLPVLLAVLVLWLQDVRATPGAALKFAAALLVGTLAILAPSLPVREGLAAYYYLSWFHLYVAAGTALCVCFMAYQPCTRNTLLVLAGLGIAALVPLGHQILLAQSFLSGTLARLDSISEMMSIPKLVRVYGPGDTASRYSLLVYAWPLTFAYCLWQGWRRRAQGQVFFWICAVCGLALLLMQVRLHYFGSFALCIPWLIALEQLTARRDPPTQRRLMLAASLVLVLAYLPSLRYQIANPPPVANDNNFANIRPMLATLARACAEDPGIVLADHDLGHLIRYYTDCSVIANNFLLTEQHGAKIAEMEQLLETPAAALPTLAPFVKYVVVRPAYITDTPNGIALVSYATGTSRLLDDLLLKAAAEPPTEPPAEYHLLHRVRVQRNRVEIPYARLYKIERPALHANAAMPRDKGQP